MGIQVKGLITGHNGYENGFDGWHPGPNSAGGVSVRLSFCITGSKTIKYAIFRFAAYNSVGDVVADTISGQSERNGQYTGFASPNKWVEGVIWENLWYNHSISRAVIRDVTLQYTDGSKEVISGNNIEYVQGVSGCYIATCVYGSYDCPQVWTLRRYRDDTLGATWYGRLFIRFYYAVSPTLVKWFGKTQWFQKFWRGKLDRKIKKLQNNGVEDTPYQDRDWRK